MTIPATLVVWVAAQWCLILRAIAADASPEPIWPAICASTAVLFWAVPMLVVEWRGGIALLPHWVPFLKALSLAGGLLGAASVSAAPQMRPRAVRWATYATAIFAMVIEGLAILLGAA